MRFLYFDCFAGISGDMTISSLLSHGIDIDKFKGELSKLPFDGYDLEFGSVKKMV